MKIEQPQEFVLVNVRRYPDVEVWHRVNDLGTATLCWWTLGRFFDSLTTQSKIERVVYGNKCPLPECPACLSALQFDVS